LLRSLPSMISAVEMISPEWVVGVRSLVARIEDDGAIIGRVGSGDFVHELVGRELTVDDARSFDVSE
jgi:hypothetical protein